MPIDRVDNSYARGGHQPQPPHYYYHHASPQGPTTMPTSPPPAFAFAAGYAYGSRSAARLSGGTQERPPRRSPLQPQPQPPSLPSTAPAQHCFDSTQHNYSHADNYTHIPLSNLKDGYTAAAMVKETAPASPSIPSVTPTKPPASSGASPLLLPSLFEEIYEKSNRANSVTLSSSTATRRYHHHVYQTQSRAVHEHDPQRNSLSLTLSPKGGLLQGEEGPAVGSSTPPPPPPPTTILYPPPLPSAYARYVLHNNEAMAGPNDNGTAIKKKRHRKHNNNNRKRRGTTNAVDHLQIVEECSTDELHRCILAEGDADLKKCSEEINKEKREENQEGSTLPCKCCHFPHSHDPPPPPPPHQPATHTGHTYIACGVRTSPAHPSRAPLWRTATAYSIKTNSSYSGGDDTTTTDGEETEEGDDREEEEVVTAGIEQEEKVRARGRGRSTTTREKEQKTPTLLLHSVKRHERKDSGAAVRGPSDSSSNGNERGNRRDNSCGNMNINNNNVENENPHLHHHHPQFLGGCSYSVRSECGSSTHPLHDDQYAEDTDKEEENNDRSHYGRLEEVQSVVGENDGAEDDGLDVGSAVPKLKPLSAAESGELSPSPNLIPIRNLFRITNAGTAAGGESNTQNNHNISTASTSSGSALLTAAFMTAANIHRRALLSSGNYNFNNLNLNLNNPSSSSNNNNNNTNNGSYYASGGNGGDMFPAMASHIVGPRVTDGDFYTFSNSTINNNPHNRIMIKNGIDRAKSSGSNNNNNVDDGVTTRAAPNETFSSSLFGNRMPYPTAAMAAAERGGSRLSPSSPPPLLPPPPYSTTPIPTPVPFMLRGVDMLTATSTSTCNTTTNNTSKSSKGGNTKKAKAQTAARPEGGMRCPTTTTSISTTTNNKNSYDNDDYSSIKYRHTHTPPNTPVGATMLLLPPPAYTASNTNAATVPARPARIERGGSAADVTNLLRQQNEQLQQSILLLPPPTPSLLPLVTFDGTYNNNTTTIMIGAGIDDHQNNGDCNNAKQIASELQITKQDAEEKEKEKEQQVDFKHNTDACGKNKSGLLGFDEEGAEGRGGEDKKTTEEEGVPVTDINTTTRLPTTQCTSVGDDGAAPHHQTVFMSKAQEKSKLRRQKQRTKRHFGRLAAHLLGEIDALAALEAHDNTNNLNNNNNHNNNNNNNNNNEDNRLVSQGKDDSPTTLPLRREERERGGGEGEGRIVIGVGGAGKHDEGKTETSLADDVNMTSSSGVESNAKEELLESPAAAFLKTEKRGVPKTKVKVTTNSREAEGHEYLPEENDCRKIGKKQNTSCSTPTNNKNKNNNNETLLLLHSSSSSPTSNKNKTTAVNNNDDEDDWVYQCTNNYHYDDERQISEELMRAHIEAAEELLLSTETPLPEGLEIDLGRGERTEKREGLKELRALVYPAASPSCRDGQSSSVLAQQQQQQLSTHSEKEVEEHNVCNSAPSSPFLSLSKAPSTSHHNNKGKHSNDDETANAENKKMGRGGAKTEGDDIDKECTCIQLSAFKMFQPSTNQAHGSLSSLAVAASASTATLHVMMKSLASPLLPSRAAVGGNVVEKGLLMGGFTVAEQLSQDEKKKQRGATSGMPPPVEDNDSVDEDDTMKKKKAQKGFALRQESNAPPTPHSHHNNGLPPTPSPARQRRSSMVTFLSSNEFVVNASTAATATKPTTTTDTNNSDNDKVNSVNKNGDRHQWPPTSAHVPDAFQADTETVNEEDEADEGSSFFSTPTPRMTTMGTSFPSLSTTAGTSFLQQQQQLSCHRRQHHQQEQEQKLQRQTTFSSVGTSWRSTCKPTRVNSAIVDGNNKQQGANKEGFSSYQQNDASRNSYSTNDAAVAQSLGVTEQHNIEKVGNGEEAVDLHRGHASSPDCSSPCGPLRDVTRTNSFTAKCSSAVSRGRRRERRAQRGTPNEEVGGDIFFDVEKTKKTPLAAQFPLAHSRGTSPKDLWGAGDKVTFSGPTTPTTGQSDLFAASSFTHYTCYTEEEKEPSLASPLLLNPPEPSSTFHNHNVKRERGKKEEQDQQEDREGYAPAPAAASFSSRRGRGGGGGYYTSNTTAAAHVDACRVNHLCGRNQEDEDEEADHYQGEGEGKEDDLQNDMYEY